MEHIRKCFTATVVLTIICFILVGCSRSKNTENAKVSDGKTLSVHNNNNGGNVTYKNEPDGFRGVKWGTDISTLKDMKAMKNAVWPFDGMERFIKVGDDLAIGDAKLKSITYYFWKGKLACVGIELVDKKGNFNKLAEILIGKFGTPQTADTDMPGTPPAYWQGKTTTITLAREGVSIFFALWFKSTSITEEYTAEKNKLAAHKVEEERLRREKRAREAKGF